MVPPVNAKIAMIVTPMIGFWSTKTTVRRPTISAKAAIQSLVSLLRLFQKVFRLRGNFQCGVSVSL
jgi:hypothetical protein